MDLSAPQRALLKDEASSWPLTVCEMVANSILPSFPVVSPPRDHRPKYGGKYCLGERKRFRICNIKPCPADKPSFRQLQCSQFDPMLYKGKLYKWTPVLHNGKSTLHLLSLIFFIIISITSRAGGLF